MSHASLAARYRPQSFSEVAGQDTVKTILSRAAAEDRIAPAYLLSGTRGVGKTTIARIFAKALNCVHAPTAEPCNQCEQCRRITQGNHVDVVEIDGASNRGIDDARRLREAIAYAPMEGRYKVFIIDEAHMLTRDAFNSLLKTLEEPPPRSTFILATTEPHKFPVTIVSRCQHFVFKSLPEAGLMAHLTAVLGKEGLDFEDNAVRLIARRAAGSVRDGMSLLGQSLALGTTPLTETVVREVLGLAGQEIHERLLLALKEQDCPAVVSLVGELLEQGADLGFFLRELTSMWRNLFLLRQCGEAALPILDLPETEKLRLLETAQGFDLAYIHAAWQMVLESQRQVLTSLEPASSLELLLLNLVLLPRLVSLEQLSKASRGAAAPASSTPPQPRPAVSPGQTAAVSTQPAAWTRPMPHPQDTPAPHPSVPAPSTAPPSAPSPSWASPARTPGGPSPMAEQPNLTPQRPLATERNFSTNRHAPGEQAQPTQGSETDTDEDPDASGAALPATDLCWEGFLAYSAEHMPTGQGLTPIQLQQAAGDFSADILVLKTSSTMLYDQLNAPQRLTMLKQLATEYAGRPLNIQVAPPSRARRTEAELKLLLAEHPVVKIIEETFDASLVRCMVLDDVMTRSPAANQGKNTKEN